MKRLQPTVKQRVLLVLNYFLGHSLIYQLLSLFLLRMLLPVLGPVDEYFLNMFINVLSSLITMIGIYLILRPQLGSFLLRPLDFKLVVKTLIYMFITLIVLGVLTSYLFEAPQADNQVMVEALFNKYQIPMMLVISIGAPIIEEFTFRFAMIDFNNPRITLWISSFLFGFIHILSIFQTRDLTQLVHLPIYMSLGYWMGLSYIKDKGILTPILIHALYNGFQGFLMMFV